MSYEEKTICLREGYIKEFKLEVYITGSSYKQDVIYKNCGFLSIILTFPNGRELFNNSEIVRLNEVELEKHIDERISALEKQFFTEDELAKFPCSTMEEYRNKLNYLKYIYIKQIPHFSADWDNFDSLKIYDPISECFVHAENEEFVKHHIWLYSQLKKTFRPTVFPMVVTGTYEIQKFLTYYFCMPFAEDDDPMLSEAKEYIENHARNVVKKIYEKTHNNSIPIELIKQGCIKKPTLKKLLEMSNDYQDTHLSAVILEELKDTQASKSRFSL